MAACYYSINYGPIGVCCRLYYVLQFQKSSENKTGFAQPTEPAISATMISNKVK